MYHILKIRKHLMSMYAIRQYARKVSSKLYQIVRIYAMSGKLEIHQEIPPIFFFSFPSVTSI